MKNKEVSKVFYEMASLLELANENRFKIRAYQNASQTLSELTEGIETLAQKNTLTELPHVGAGISDKIKEYCKTGKIEEFEKLKQKFPEGLLEMMTISGLGPKRTKILFEKMKIDSVEKLKEAALKGLLHNIEGFGTKTEENILKGITVHDVSSKRMLLDEAYGLAQEIVSKMKKKCRSLEICVPAGSLRRWKETVGDLDFLCISDDPKEIIHEFIHLDGVKQILAQGSTKASVRNLSGIQWDLRVVSKESFGAALNYFTGSKEHNVALREIALKKGFTINEYGLYSLDNKNKILAGRTEEEIYEKLGLEFIPPELRENRGEIELAQQKKLPKLIEEKDIRGDLHNHTNLSDGSSTLEEMATRAKEKGWEWFVSGDHSQSLKIARGLDKNALAKKREEVDTLNKKWESFELLLGSEVDILSDGTLDYDEESLKKIDFVVASIHTGFSQTEEKITNRILKAMENPHTDAIGHLTGRLIGSRDAYPVKVQKILEAAKIHGTALEINGQPQRLDLTDTVAKSAGEMNIPLILSTDAHSTRQLDFMTFAVAQARRAWIRKEDVLNTLSTSELKDWMGAE